MIEKMHGGSSLAGSAIRFGDVERIREALRFIDPSDRDTWVKMGFAIKGELGDAGFDVWNEWSQQADSYDYSAAMAVWKSAGVSGAVKIGTLFHAAKANGWRHDSSYQQPHEVLVQRGHSVPGAAAKQEVKEARERNATMKKANAIYNAATSAVHNPYLLRKKVSPVATLRQIEVRRAAAILGYSPKSNGELLEGRLLVVPVKQGERITTLELIDGEKRKAALAGRGTKTGGYWATERLPGGDGRALTLLIGEGVATALSASAASGHVAVAALSSSNLKAVANAMRDRYPLATLVILADLVKATGEPDPHAVEAAQAVGGKLAAPEFGRDREYDMKDFNDLAQVRGAGAVAQALATARFPESVTVPAGVSGSVCAPTNNDGWTEPQPLAVNVAPEPYPFDALPDPIRAAVQEVAAFVKAPVPMVAMSALATLSLALQAHADVKRLEKLYGPIGLFLLVIADSGERKSTCDGFFMKPICDYEAAQAEAAKPDVKDYNAALDAWDAKRSGIKEKIRQLAKDNKPTAGMEAALRDLEYDKPQPPKVPRLLYADVTPEALAFGLAKQWPSGGVVSAEAGIVFGSHGMSKDSVMRNLALLNQLWDGKSVTVDRRSTESFKVSGSRLTVALQVQGPTLREFFARTGALARGTGFLARFLIAWPESTQGTRQIDPSAPDGPTEWPDLAAFEQRVSTILQQPIPIGEDDALTPPLLELSAKAKAAWVEFHNAIECALSSGGELYDVRDVASKAADNAARLAALFYIFHGGVGTISVDAFEGASRIVAWHLNEARRFLGELALPAEVSDAARLDGWLIARCKQGCTHSIGKNYVRQHGPIRDGARLDAAIAALARLARLRLVKDGKQLTIQLNPSLLSAGE